MSSYPASICLYLAAIAAVAALLCVVCSGEARTDVRFWLTVAVVASSLYAATRSGAHAAERETPSAPQSVIPAS